MDFTCPSENKFSKHISILCLEFCDGCACVRVYWSLLKLKQKEQRNVLLLEPTYHYGRKEIWRLWASMLLCYQKAVTLLFSVEVTYTDHLSIYYKLLGFFFSRRDVYHLKFAPITHADMGDAISKKGEKLNLQSRYTTASTVICW